MIGESSPWMRLSRRERTKRAVVQQLVATAAVGLAVVTVRVPWLWAYGVIPWLAAGVFNVGLVIDPRLAAGWMMRFMVGALTAAFVVFPAAMYVAD